MKNICACMACTHTNKNHKYWTFQWFICPFGTPAQQSLHETNRISGITGVCNSVAPIQDLADIPITDILENEKSILMAVPIHIC